MFPSSEQVDKISKGKKRLKHFFDFSELGVECRRRRGGVAAGRVMRLQPAQCTLHAVLGFVLACTTSHSGS